MVLLKGYLFTIDKVLSLIFILMVAYIIYAYFNLAVVEACNVEIYSIPFGYWIIFHNNSYWYLVIDLRDI
jgi:hypothetical protein